MRKTAVAAEARNLVVDAHPDSLDSVADASKLFAASEALQHCWLCSLRCLRNCKRFLRATAT